MRGSDAPISRQKLLEPSGLPPPAPGQRPMLPAQEGADVEDQHEMVPEGDWRRRYLPYYGRV